MWLARIFLANVLLGILLSCQERKYSVVYTADALIREENKLDKWQMDSTYIARDLNLYNDVLNDLIKHHFYFYYLGKNHDKMYEGYDGRTPIDTVLLNKRQRELTQNLLANPGQLCTLYINISQEVRSKEFDLKFGENEKLNNKIKTILSKYGDGSPAQISYLNARQQFFSKNDFHSSIANIFEIRDSLRKHIFSFNYTRNSKNNCEIGVVALSNSILDTKRKKGVLYYEFYCGSRCGRGELAEIEKIKGKWKVVNTVLFWIS